MNTPHYLTCKIGTQWYGIPVNIVVEVLHMVLLDDLPSAAPDILGLLTLRNIVMPVIDLRRRFGSDETAIQLNTPIIAMQQDEQYFAIVVDAVDDVVDTSAASWQAQTSDTSVTHTVRIQEKLVLILDMSNLQSSIRNHSI